MTPWITLAGSIATTLVLVGIAFGKLRQQVDTLHALNVELKESISDLKSSMKTELEDIKDKKASLEKVEYLDHRLDRFEGYLREKIDDIKDLIRSANRPNSL